MKRISISKLFWCELIRKSLRNAIKEDENIVSGVIRTVVIQNSKRFGKLVSSLTRLDKRTASAFLHDSIDKLFLNSKYQINDYLMVCALKYTNDSQVLDILNQQIEHSYKSLIDYFSNTNELSKLDYSIGCLLIRSLFNNSTVFGNSKNIENFMNVLFLKLIYNFEKHLKDDSYFYTLQNFNSFLCEEFKGNNRVVELKFSYVRNLLTLIDRQSQIKAKNKEINNKHVQRKIEQLQVLIDQGIDTVIVVYDFKDFYLESDEIFKKSVACGLIKKLIKVLLDDYNYMINLSSLNESDSNKIRELNNWQKIGSSEENSQMFQILIFFDLLASKLNKKLLNRYLQDKIVKNFNLNFLHNKVFTNYSKKNADFFTLLIKLLFRLDTQLGSEIQFNSFISQFLSGLNKFGLFRKEIAVITNGYLDDLLDHFRPQLVSLYKNDNPPIDLQNSVSQSLENIMMLFQKSLMRNDLEKYEEGVADFILDFFITSLCHFFEEFNKSFKDGFDFSESFQISLTVIWIKLMKNYYLMTRDVKKKLKRLAVITPHLKTTKYFKMHEIEVNIILKETEGNKRNIKAIFNDYPKLKESKKTFLIYNFIFYFIFKNKVVLFKSIDNARDKSISSNFGFVENAFLYLREDYETHVGKKAGEFLSNIKKTLGIVIKEYREFLNEITNFNTLSEIVKQDFPVLMQYAVSENKTVKKLAREMLESYIERYPFMLYSTEIFDTSVVILDTLFKNYNSKFSTISTHLLTNYGDQMIKIPLIKVV